MASIKVILETGSKRTIVSALDWPGWTRSGRDETSALQALFDYAPRYARAIRKSGLKFDAPDALSSLVVVERAQGNATTDFGAPAIVSASDRDDMSPKELKRGQILSDGCWDSLEAAGKKAEGKELRKGPRGGGRELDEIVRHVLDANVEYLKKIAWRQKSAGGKNPVEAIQEMRNLTQRALEIAVREGLPEQGPRGGALWPPRYFARRAAWHVLDHVWEIEDRN